MSTAIISGRMSRLAEQLGDLRGRLQQAARYEVAQAVGDTLAETAKMLICGTVHAPHQSHDADPWDDDSWDDSPPSRSTWSDDRIEEERDEPIDRELPTRSAVLAGLAVARWSLMRTGQPTVAIGLASATAILILLAGKRIMPLLDALATAQELIDYPVRRP